MQECRIEKNISKQEKQIADTHRSRWKTEGKKLNLEIFDSEGDRGSREDDGKDAGAANYVTDFAHNDYKNRADNNDGGDKQ